MQQISQQLCSLPVYIIYLSNSQVAFQRTCDFDSIFDQSPSGQTLAVISNEILLVGTEDFLYNTAYSISDSLRIWLQNQNLVSPI